MPETTTFELDLFWKLLEMRILSSEQVQILFLQICRKKLSVWEAQ